MQNSDPSGYYTNNPQPPPDTGPPAIPNQGGAQPGPCKATPLACGITLKIIVTVVAHAKPRAYVSAAHGSTSVPWYKNPFVTGALGHGAAALGIDAVGFFPGGRALAEGIGSLNGYRGIVAIQQGTKAIQTGKAAVGILGGISALGDHSGLGAASAALGVASMVPVIGDFATPLAMATDTLRTGMDIRDCY